MTAPTSAASTRRLAAGIDLGGTKILGQVLDPSDPRRPIAEHRVDTPRGGEAIVAAIVDLLAELGAGLHGTDRIDAVGVGAAGLVDLAGVLRFAPNLPGVIDLDIAGGLGAAVDVPVVVDNDANCATWGEFRAGAAVGTKHAILVTLGTGIGAGLISDGRLQRGGFGFAGEPGHMRVDPVGPPCPCGRRGCWERFASGSGLARLAREAAEAGRIDGVVARAGGDPEAVRGEHLTELAREGDEGALAVIEQFAWWVAVGVANLVDLFDPEIVVIGGGLAAAGDLLLVPVRAAFDELVLGVGHRPPTRIEAATLGPQAGAIGAALFAAESCFGDEGWGH